MRDSLTIVEYPRKPLKLPRRTRLVSKVKRSSKKKKRPAKRRIKRSTIVAKLDTVFSLYVRTKFAAKAESLNCYTCPKVGTIKTMQAGHYVTRSIRSLRWDESNVKVQCFGCNIMHGGQPITFRENLIKEYGEIFVLMLEQQRHQLFTPTDEWLQEKIDFYTQQVLSLRKDIVE